MAEKAEEAKEAEGAKEAIFDLRFGIYDLSTFISATSTCFLTTMCYSSVTVRSMTGVFTIGVLGITIGFSISI